MRAGGLIVQAQDTGRVLMIQRTPDKHDDDATFARWEWPGGCLDVDDPGVWAGALREWEEETGSALDESAQHVGSFLDGDGVYQAYVIRVPSESDLEFDVQPEEVADITWWEPADLTDARVRGKVRDNLAPLQRFLLAPVVKYSDDEPRDDDGKWTSGGGGAGSSDSESGHYGGSGRSWPRSAVEAAESAKAEPSVPAKAWQNPPVPKGKEAEAAPGGGGMTAVGITNTKLGDSVEAAVIGSGLGFTEAHPGIRQGPFDVLHGKDAYEIKAVTTDSTEFKARPSSQAVADKKAFAQEFGLTPHIMIVVYNKDTEAIEMYSKEGVGAYRLSGEEHGWSYLGSAHLGKDTLGLAKALGRSAADVHRHTDAIVAHYAPQIAEAFEEIFPENALSAAIEQARAAGPVAKYSDDEPRDDRGRWTSGDGGGDGGSAGSGGGPGRGSAAERTDASTRMLGELQGSGLTGNDAFNAYATGRLPDTQALNRSADPDTGELRYSADRSELHQQIVDGAVGDHASQERPQALFTAGGPASGKGSLYGGSDVGGMTDAQAGRGEKLAGPSDAVVVDPDRIKMGTAGYQGLPEFKGLGAAGRTDAASAAVHEESSDVAAQVTSAAYEKQANVVVDGVGDSSGDKFAGKIMAAQAAGYDVTLRYAVTDPSTAVDRAIERGARTGRQLTPEMVTNAHAAVAQTFVRSIQNGVPGVKIEVYDSTSGRQLAASRDGAGKWTIQNPAVYTDFVARGTTSAAAKSEAQGLAVINDSANYDLVTRPAFPYKLRDGTVVDLTDREKFPLATDHERFKPVPPAA